MPRRIRSKTADVGRPAVPPEKRKVRVSLSISPNLLYKIDKSRGKCSRSEYVESFLREPRTPYESAERLERNANGRIYTPSCLAKYVSDRAVSFLFAGLTCSGRPNRIELGKLRVIDPACGDGELLCSIWETLQSEVGRRNGNSRFRLPPANAGDILCGVDIDSKAVQRTKQRIKNLHKVTRASSIKLITTNALFPYNGSNPHIGWERLKEVFDAREGFDVVIANPPWGADVSGYRDFLSGGHYEMYKGQFDTADLFLELALSICKEGGYIAYIVPDSLFSQEREKLRSVLASQTSLHLVARLGEKVFDQVNRACAVLVCEKTAPGPKTKTLCLRLTPEVRKRVLAGTMTFNEAEKRLAHSVPQKRFLNNGGNRFDIDVTVSEERIIAKFHKGGSTLRSLLSNARGVELSKLGRVVKCETCGIWQPRPNTDHGRCKGCDADIDVLSTAIETVVTTDRIEGYTPFYVGESVQRYALGPCLWLDPAKRGLNYKGEETYYPPKLLVRKTGVGISATIDYSSSYTNQVVYIFHLRQITGKSASLEACLGIMNSRVMYYYLAKKHGETEWRSHPYITQSQVLDLPTPFNGKMEDSARAACMEIERLVKATCKGGKGVTIDVDARIERNVARLFGLTRSDYEAIYATLDNVQALLPVRVLKNVTLDAIFGTEEA